MSSATKTLALLGYFSPARPEIGLSQLCKLAGRDKATTYRHLQSLESAGFVEQNPATKQYRLGPALLQLAQTRELTVPRKAGATQALQDLANATGETAHISVLSGTEIYALDACESPTHSTRAIIDIQTFPLHATASGLCALAFGPPALVDTAVARMRRFTPHTATTRAQLDAAIDAARASGFARADRSLESEIHSLAAPVFDQTGQCAGAISVACVATRVTPALERSIRQNLVTASRTITRNWGGAIPQNIEAIWARTTALEPTP